MFLQLQQSTIVISRRFNCYMRASICLKGTSCHICEMFQNVGVAIDSFLLQNVGFVQLYAAIDAAESKKKQQWRRQKVTGVVGHGGLLAVPLLLKLDVAQLEDGGDHLQHPCTQPHGLDETVSRRFLPH